jgi:hypothetical protein
MEGPDPAWNGEARASPSCFRIARSLIREIEKFVPDVALRGIECCVDCCRMCRQSFEDGGALPADFGRSAFAHRVFGSPGMAGRHAADLHDIFTARHRFHIGHILLLVHKGILAQAGYPCARESRRKDPRRAS